MRNRGAVRATSQHPCPPHAPRVPVGSGGPYLATRWVCKHALIPARPHADNPTCGWVRDAQGDRIPASQGFCCQCGLADGFGEVLQDSKQQKVTRRAAVRSALPLCVALGRLTCHSHPRACPRHSKNEGFQDAEGLRPYYSSEWIWHRQVAQGCQTEPVFTPPQRADVSCSLLENMLWLGGTPGSAHCLNWTTKMYHGYRIGEARLDFAINVEARTNVTSVTPDWAFR